MSDEKYMRQVQTSVTCFLYHEDHFLFLLRNKTKRIDPGRLNGIGGRVEPGEDFLAAAIRETEEETGYKITHHNVQLSCIGRLEGGYSEDWVMAFFKINVPTKQIPLGTKTEDGELLWIHKDKVLDSEYELVDDINYCFKDIMLGRDIVFFNAKINDREKIEEINISKLNTSKEGI